jgi:hypothetical protein
LNFSGNIWQYLAAVHLFQVLNIATSNIGGVWSCLVAGVVAVGVVLVGGFLMGVVLMGVVLVKINPTPISNTRTKRVIGNSHTPQYYSC